MHFAHFIPHILGLGGVPAGIGLALAAFLGWPREDLESSRLFGETPLITAPTYHNLIGGSGMTLEAAFSIMIGLGVFLGLVGLFVGYLLVELGVLKKEDLGAAE